MVCGTSNSFEQVLQSFYFQCTFSYEFQHPFLPLHTWEGCGIFHDTTDSFQYHNQGVSIEIFCSPHSGSNLFCNCKENTLCVRRKEKLESWSAHSAMDGSSRKTDLGLELVLTTVVDIQTEQKRCWHDANGALITGFLTCSSFHCCPSHATPRPRPTTWECLGRALFSRKAHFVLIYPFL